MKTCSTGDGERSPSPSVLECHVDVISVLSRGLFFFFSVTDLLLLRRRRFKMMGKPVTEGGNLKNSLRKLASLNSGGEFQHVCVSDGKYSFDHKLSDLSTTLIDI